MSRRFLITGGTGSFGKAFVSHLLSNSDDISRIVIYSRDELKQWELMSYFNDLDKCNLLRYFLGDIRDKDRLARALNGIDTVVHAAALKQVPAAEYNPFEFIKTNVIGTQNLVESCLDAGVRNIVALSTDKAAAPINMYGATKLCADKLVISANNIVGADDIRFSIVRYGNVMGSRGSVIPFFLKSCKQGFMNITDSNMTRFNILLEEAVQMVLWALENHFGGEIFVPKIPSYHILDLAKAICPECTLNIVGVRPGEKIHEEMITGADSYNTIDLGAYYAILPTTGSVKELYQHRGLLPDNSGLIGKSYNSGSNPSFLSVDELRELIASSLNVELPITLAS